MLTGSNPGSDWRNDMPLTTVLITIVAAGLLLWIVNRFIPMQGQVKSILNGLVVVVLVIWIANLYGVFQHLNGFRVGR
jgi:chromate transport protein ChrA